VIVKMDNSCPTRVLVLWADEHSSNLGVQALAFGTRIFIDQVISNAEVTHISYGASGDRHLELTARNLTSALVGVNRGFARWLGGFDLVVDTGAGDSFADIYGQRRLAEMSALRVLIRRQNIRLVMGPQTIGPFDTRTGRWVARKSVGSQAVVVARDGASLKAAEKLLTSQVLHATDVAFLLPKSPPVKREGVVLNVSGLLWEKNPHVDYAFYRDQVLAFAELVQNSGKNLTLLSHVTDSSHTDNDIRAVDACRNMLTQQPDVFHPTDLSDVRARLAGAEIVVASRMHAVLNSLSQGVPAIGWSYSRKFAPLLSDLGWNHLFDLKEGKPAMAKETFSAITMSKELAVEAEQVSSNAQKRMISVVQKLKATVSIG
jgi:colanic acid/amylovoran biosynthesis protein